MVNKPFIGQLDRKVKIIELSVQQNAIGENKPVETVFCEPWAKLEDLSGNEDIDGKVIHLINRKYTIRYRAEILADGFKMILQDGNQKFSVTHVKQIGRKQYLELYCNIYE